MKPQSASFCGFRSKTPPLSVRTVSPEFELATSDMLIQFALRNLGIASVMEEFAKEYEEDGRLFKLQFEKEIPARKFCIVLNERIPMSAAAAKLLKGLL